MAGTATLVSGAETYTGSAIVGKTIAEAREQFEAPFGISIAARASVNNNPVANEDGTYINANDTVTFTTAVGEKGA